TFEYTLDAKNRLTVPSKFRAVLADGVVLAKGVEPCVAVWTPAAYEAQTAAALAGRNPLSPQARELARFFAANAIDTELHSAGPDRRRLHGRRRRPCPADRRAAGAGGDADRHRPRPDRRGALRRAGRRGAVRHALPARRVRRRAGAAARRGRARGHPDDGPGD